LPLDLKLFFVSTNFNNFINALFDGFTPNIGLSYLRASAAAFKPSLIGMFGYKAVTSNVAKKGSFQVNLLSAINVKKMCCGFFGFFS
jgi:hypothetical protein